MNTLISVPNGGLVNASMLITSEMFLAQSFLCFSAVPV
jgi:hypothetical protein